MSTSDDRISGDAAGVAGQEYVGLGYDEARRRSLDDSRRTLSLELADLKARHERAQALLDAPDQRVVVWDGDENPPTCRGSLASASGTPSGWNEGERYTWALFAFLILIMGPKHPPPAPPRWTIL